MTVIDILKAKRVRCEEEDLCFYSGKYLRNPEEIFHPLIGFVTVSKINEKDFNSSVSKKGKYDNKYTEKDK